MNRQGISKKWLERDWRTLRLNDVVIDEDGVKGHVTHVEGEIGNKLVTVQNLEGSEIHTLQGEKNFLVVEIPEAKEYFTERFSRLGFKKGAICQFQSNDSMPLEVLDFEWSTFDYKPRIYLKSLIHYTSEPLVTRKYQQLKIFDLEYPSIENIFSTLDSGLKWRLEVNLIEKERELWCNVGSPWEFMKKEDALAEVEAWKERLKIRRVASVLNAGWIPSMPAWVVDTDGKNCKVKKVVEFSGYAGYFRSAMHAALAMKILPLESWKKALFVSQDYIF